jgi:beta-glucosidase
MTLFPPASKSRRQGAGRPAARARAIAGLGFLSLASLGLALAGAGAAAAPATPYALPVRLPAPQPSPAQDPAAPYTPVVMDLIAQLLPGTNPSAADLARAADLLTALDGANPSCHNLANVLARTPTTPRILPQCFSDGLGIYVVNGPNVEQTTGFPSMLALGSSFDRVLANATGQAIGREGRNLMVTGYLGPQLDTNVFVNWARGHHTPGEDPWLNGVIGAAEINGIQSQGLMVQVKHFAGYNGTADGRLVDIQDQALHEILLTPYELALKDGGAASIMCSYQYFRVDTPYLARTANALIQPSPYGKESVDTWPLNEAHYACEHPLTLTYTLRHLWKSAAFVGSDYSGVHSASSLLQGLDREDPTSIYFGASNLAVPPARMAGGPPAPTPSLLDPTGSTCADAAGNAVACTVPGAIRVAGIPGPGCPATGCSIANAVANGSVPLAFFKQSLARVLYQLERFGMLGCDNTHADCTNPGGVGRDRSGTAPLPQGASKGPPELGSKSGNAAIAMLVAEQGAVLLKNEARTRQGKRTALPITGRDLEKGIAVSGGGAEYLVANPNNEGAPGFPDRNAVSPLGQLMALSGRPDGFVFTPANSPSGQTVPCAMLSSVAPDAGAAAHPRRRCSGAAGLRRSSGASLAQLDEDGVDASLDRTASAGQRALPGGKIYRWDGWLYVARPDDYTLRLQHSPAIADAKVTLELDGVQKTLVDAASFYQGQYYGMKSVTVSPTTAGYLDAGLRNRQCAAPPGAGPKMAVPVFATDVGNADKAPDVPCDTRLAVGWHKVRITLDATGVARDDGIKLRFAWSRTQGDIEDAATAAKGKAMAIVFVNDQGRDVVTPAPAQGTPVSSLNPDQVALIRAVAAANPNTVVVLNTGTPVIVKEWIGNPGVKALLNMWHAGQEGGTATARLLLGHANPAGHTSITWPLNGNDTIHGYQQKTGLYAEDTAGSHPERLNGAGNGNSVMTQGIYSGYRYYDQLGVPVQFPFGFGLSYTTFKFAALRTSPRADGGLDVTFDVRNTGDREGAAVPQVYVGAGPAVTGVQQAVRALRGFDRVVLKPGEQCRVTIALGVRSFQYWSEKEQQWVTNAGPRRVYVGDASSPDHLPLSADIVVAALAADH